MSYFIFALFLTVFVFWTFYYFCASFYLLPAYGCRKMVAGVLIDRQSIAGSDSINTIPFIYPSETPQHTNTPTKTPETPKQHKNTPKNPDKAKKHTQPTRKPTEHGEALDSNPYPRSQFHDRYKHCVDLYGVYFVGGGVICEVLLVCLVVVCHVGCFMVYGGVSWFMV